MFQNLINWSLKEYGYLPWRTKRTVYRTLVSEIMLQQTTVSTVLNKFEDFLLQFPTLESIANASEDQLTIAWKGLGYYRRCRNLKKACEYFVKEHKGQIPMDFAELVAAPGIGDYTANAILSIGLDQKAIAVDANLERVLARLYRVEIEKGPKLIKEIYKLFNDKKILKNYKGSFRDLNESLMDLGRVFCTLRSPKCEICPMKKKCLSLKEKKQNLIPNANNKKKESYVEIDLLRIFVKHNNKILVYKKDKNEWLSGQVELPTFTLNKSLDQYPEFKSSVDLSNLISFKTNITKYKFTNYIYEMNKEEFKKISKNSKYYFNKLDLDSENFSTASIKAIKKREGL